MVSRERYRGFYGGEPGSFTLMKRQYGDAPAPDFLLTQSGLFAGIQPRERLMRLPGFMHATTEPTAVQNAPTYLKLRYADAQRRHAAAAYFADLKEKTVPSSVADEKFKARVAKKRQESIAERRIQALKLAAVEHHASAAAGEAIKTAATVKAPETAAVATPPDLNALKEAAARKNRIDALPPGARREIEITP